MPQNDSILARISPALGMRTGRAAAIAEANGPEAGLAVLVESPSSRSPAISLMGQSAPIFLIAWEGQRRHSGLMTSPSVSPKTQPSGISRLENAMKFPMACRHRPASTVIPMAAAGRKALPQEGGTVKTKHCLTIAVIFVAVCPALAQDAKTKYPSMAPLEQYLMSDRNAEIALARSAAPESISANAEVLVLTSHGFESAVKGTNGFVCIVERSWATGTEDPDFWSPNLRAPICYNAPGARSELAITFKKTEWVLAGRSKEQISEALRAAFEKKELPTPERGAMCYMLSRQGHLNDRDGHWHPHLMFFVPQSEPGAWGAGLAGSPILSFDDPQEHQAALVIKVGQWSDGTVDQEDVHGTK